MKNGWYFDPENTWLDNFSSDVSKGVLVPEEEGEKPGFEIAKIRREIRTAHRPQNCTGKIGILELNFISLELLKLGVILYVRVY